MKILVDGVELFTLSNFHKKVLLYDVYSTKLDEDLKRRLKWVLMHKCDNVLAKLKKDWTPKLIERGIKSIPEYDDEFCALVFSQEDYLDKLEQDTFNMDKARNKQE